MPTLRRGDVFLAPIPYSNGLPGSIRPAVVVQTDNLGTGLDQVVVALITSTLDRATHPSRVFLALATVQSRNAGLTRDSVVLTDNLVTVQSDLVVRVIGSVDMAGIDAALRHTLSL